MSNATASRLDKTSLNGTHEIVVPKPKVTATVETITPKIAQAALDFCLPNRTMRRANQRRLNRTAEKEGLELNGESIIFADTGELMDGTHRMRSCVASGKSFEAVVVRGVPKDRFKSIDSGTTRNTSDVMSIAGYAHSVQMTSLMRIVYGYANRCLTMASGRILPLDRGTSNELLALAETQPHAMEAIRFAQACKKCGAIGRQQATLAFLKNHYLNLGKPTPGADAFFEQIRTQLGWTNDSPAYILHRRLEGIPMRGSRVAPGVVVALAVKAFWSASSGEPLKQLKINDREEFPYWI